jgi:dUTP pyrophosphatase
MDVQIHVTRLHPDAVIPTYAHSGDAGADISSTESVELAPGQRYAVSTGLAIALPVGYVALLHPRSGLALKSGIGMVNAPGTIDAGYRGEIKVLLINHDPENTFIINKGDRIAQMVIQKVEAAVFAEVDTLDNTQRGTGGFGSTGVTAKVES